MNIKDIFVQDANTEMVFAFNGVVTQDIIVSLGETVKGELSLYVSTQVVNRVFAVFIEMAQNVLHYSDEKHFVNNQAFGKGQIALVNNKDMFEIISSNTVSADYKDLLLKKSQTVNNLNCEELKDLYLKTRRQKTLVSAKGAGLGFIDIARRSDKPLEVQFDYVDEFYYKFTLTARIVKV